AAGARSRGDGDESSATHSGATSPSSTSGKEAARQTGPVRPSGEPNSPDPPHPGRLREPVVASPHPVTASASRSSTPPHPSPLRASAAASRQASTARRAAQQITAAPCGPWSEARAPHRVEKRQSSDQILPRGSHRPPLDPSMFHVEHSTFTHLRAKTPALPSAILALPPLVFFRPPPKLPIPR